MNLNDSISLTNCGVQITDACVQFILKHYFKDGDFKIEKANLCRASDNMIGFLSDYWRLEIAVNTQDTVKVLHFFGKAISRSNPAKAAMVHEMKLFKKEVFFYDVIKKNMNVEGLKLWSPDLIATLEDAMVYQDLTFFGYKNRDRLLRFDKAHTLQALHTLAAFHSTSLIYEENKRKLNASYSIIDDYEEHLDKGGFNEENLWFIQCMNGALEAVKAYSKYQKLDIIKAIDEKWKNVWISALSLCDYSTVHRNVVCHRDLWNNNILFHYNKDNEPDGCVLVDFQAIKLQPPAGDVMSLLYCNLDPTFRDANMPLFLDYYYDSLKIILEFNGCKVIPKDQFLKSAEEQRKWGLIMVGCLMPQIIVSDELTTKTFTNTDRFEDIMTRSKGEFIKEMMKDDIEYRIKVLEILEEIIDRYIL